MQEQTDRELVALARAGDKEAFGDLLGRYQPMALRIAQRMVRQEEVARELVQTEASQIHLSLFTALTQAGHIYSASEEKSIERLE